MQIGSPNDKLQPIIVYGSNISYFSGKLENYFRYKGIPYSLKPLSPAVRREALRELGLAQMPTLKLGDGRWMTDTTKTIQWFEAHTEGPSILPGDPVQQYLSYLIEDYADEWLWRPAMHYRWHYPKGAFLQSRHLADEVTEGVPLPLFIKRALIRRRQRNGYTVGDGMGKSKANVAGVEQIYLRLLQQLENIFRHRPFLFGNRPTLADIGLSGPFFRHFALDPVPLEIMREQAPAVLEWVARLWNARDTNFGGELVGGVPADFEPLLDDIGAHHLPYLCANIDAVAAGKKRFNVELGGVQYKDARYSRYRVWCLQELRSHFEALPEIAKTETENLLCKHNIWEPLWQHQSLPLLEDQEEGLPFKASTKMVGVNEKL